MNHRKHRDHRRSSGTKKYTKISISSSVLFSVLSVPSVVHPSSISDADARPQPPSSPVAKHHRHLMPSIAEQPRSNHFAVMRMRSHPKPAHLPHGQRLAQQKRHPAQRKIARHDLMRSVRRRTIQNRDRRLALQRIAVVLPSIGGR